MKRISMKGVKREQDKMNQKNRREINDGDDDDDWNEFRDADEEEKQEEMEGEKREEKYDVDENDDSRNKDKEWSDGTEKDEFQDSADEENENKFEKRGDKEEEEVYERSREERKDEDLEREEKEMQVNEHGKVKEEGMFVTVESQKSIKRAKSKEGEQDEKSDSKFQFRKWNVESKKETEAELEEGKERIGSRKKEREVERSKRDYSKTGVNGKVTSRSGINEKNADLFSEKRNKSGIKGKRRRINDDENSEVVDPDVSSKNSWNEIQSDEPEGNRGGGGKLPSFSFPPFLPDGGVIPPSQSPPSLDASTVSTLSSSSFTVKHSCRELQHQCTLFMNPGYVIYSACGSFFLPMIFMCFCYFRIYLVASTNQTAMSRGYVDTGGPQNRQHNNLIRYNRSWARII